MSYARYGRPALKSSVDVQLQTAFSDGNWNSVIRLADKRAKSLKDPYYEVIKICAESQLDGVAEKCAVLIAIDELAKQKTIPDIDALELYEWAAGDFLEEDIDYADTLGPLRVKWAKANPKNTLAIECLQSCLDHWDLVSAQQIATALDKAYLGSGDRRYMFWSISLTYLLSVSPQCSETSRKVYSLLVLKQLERAAAITEDSPKVESTDRGLLNEEEILLYYRVLLAHGTKEDFLKRVQSPRLGALSQLKEGHKTLFWESLGTLESWAEWDLIYDLCLQALRLGLNGTTPTFFVCDWRVWKSFVAAASKAADPDIALGEVKSILKEFLAIDTKAAEMYKKNLILALLETTFRLPATTSSSDVGKRGLTPRVIQMGLFLDQYFERLSAFDDVKDYVADLTFEEAKVFMEDVVPNILDGKPDKLRQVILTSLKCKLQYLLTTCPHTLSYHPSVVDGQKQGKPYRCRFCSHLTPLPCEHCLKQVILEAATTHMQISADKELISAIPRLDKDPRLDLSLVIGTSLLKLAALPPNASGVTPPAMRNINPGLLLQGIVVLEAQLRETPSDSGIRLLLVQLHLLIGCATYAHQLWVPMDVKRTIQDALSPLFFDRISSISPGLFQGSRPLMEPLRSYYSNSLRDNCPLRVWDSFSAGSYTSILGMSEYDDTLRRSCTLMMTLVEERRASRAFGGKIDTDIEAHHLTASITDGTTFLNKTDYGSFSNLESFHGPPIQDFIRVGPELSNERARLSYVGEQFLDLLGFKPPKDYKPAKTNEAAIRDRNYILECLAHQSNSLTNVLHQSKTASLLTSSELSYFTTLSLLSAVLLTSISTTRADSAPKNLPLLTASIRSSLTSLRTTYQTTSPLHTSSTFFSLSNMHMVAHTRDTAAAAKHAAAFVLALHDRELARDRSGKSALHKDVVAEMKALESVAGKTLAETKSHVQKLKESLGESGWLDNMLGWVFGEGDETEDEPFRQAVSGVLGGTYGAEEWAGKVLESWREGVKGWGMVRWE
ncbi:N-acetyltransferase B complex non catalytic subunit-domain-containing protein [Lasiosphaeria hispida]|uniref:N-acetyltransferase B complex non catalytic subunit-domain-containing protein n=1 Tax=Lasiosphaeria hispida TaxID=260671 RepID=A0AAJ0HB65_9PEZI|nr:N-acetyltransferase B complex non catalytic subunit-domain-containing protein [Lasiosphaeria hispida]